MRRIRQNPAAQTIGVIAVTSYPSKWTKREALQAGCDDYIVKPIVINDLITKVLDVASRRRP